MNWLAWVVFGLAAVYLTLLIVSKILDMKRKSKEDAVSDLGPVEDYDASGDGSGSAIE